MIIKNILAQLKEATRPVSKIIKAGGFFKSVAIGLKKGIIWHDHKAVMPAKLIVAEGRVIYRQGESKIELEKFDDLDIPINIIHSLEAEEDSICILIQSSN
jgi:quercetin dioxygenase-like cupin family protein